MMKKRPFPPKVPLPKTPPKKAAKPKPPPAVKKGPVSSVSETFAAFFRLCKRRLLPVLAAALLSTAAGLFLLAGLGWGLLTALGMNAGQAMSLFLDSKGQAMLASPVDHLPLLGGWAAMLLAVFLVWSWIWTAMLAAAVDEGHGIIEALCTGWKNLFPMLWVNMLFLGLFSSWLGLVMLMMPAAAAALSFLIPAFSFNIQEIGLAGGSIIFMAAGIIGMLLIMLLVISVPLSMIFACIVLLDEGRSGMDALLASRFYVRGCWWNTFFKLLLMWVILSMLTMPLSLLHFFVDIPGQQLAAQLISFCFTMPLSILYMVTVYRDLKQASGKADLSTAWRCLWMPMALIGILLPLLALLGLALTGGPKKMEDLFSRILGGGAPSAPVIEEPAAPPPAPEVRTLPSVDGFIVWRDPTGDTGNPLLDIREVSALGKDGVLELTVTMAQPLPDYFAAAGPDAFDPLVKFYFDVDMDTATGAAAGGGQERGGFDLELDVLLLTGPDGGGRAYPSIYALSRAGRQSLAPLEEGTAAISGNTLTLRLPYSRIDGTPGGRFKICFQEAAQREDSLSRERTVPLR
uniref:hypothetical protein n=1 Tax=Candidatus Electronema sp. TaxID=2698783 RepID=UPI0040565925